MQEIKLQVIGWKKYQPQSDRSRHKHWFRVNMDCGTSHGLFGLSAEQRWFWIQLLCECCRKDSDTVSIKLTRFAKLCEIEEDSILSAIKLLEENDTVSVVSAHCQSTVSPLRPHNNTTQHITRQNITKQNISIDANASRLASPSKGSSNSKLIGEYVKAYQARYKARPVIDGRTQGLVRTILKTIPEDQACDLVQAFVQMNDPWFVKKAHDFPTFYENLTKVSMSLQTGKDHGAPEKKKTWIELLQEDERKLPDGN